MPIRTVYKVPYRSSASYAPGLSPALHTSGYMFYAHTMKRVNERGFTYGYAAWVSCVHLDHQGRAFRVVKVKDAGIQVTRSRALRKAKEALNLVLAAYPADSITESRENT